MRKIDMTPYNVTVTNTDNVVKEIRYGLKESLVNILFHPNLKLNSANLLRQDELAKKILSSEDELLLEEEEYARLKVALEAVQGLGKNDVEFVKRILNAPEVKVEVKESK